jgi:hypothetical protein
LVSRVRWELPPEVKLDVPPPPEWRKIVPLSGVPEPRVTIQTVAERSGAPGHTLTDRLEIPRKEKPG